MKRLLAMGGLMAALALLLGLAAFAAQGGANAAKAAKYDKEFTIFVNGSGKWTPFPGKSGVKFTNSDEDAVFSHDNGSQVDFLGMQVGAAIITATSGTEKRTALVRVRAMEAKAKFPNIVYNPPPEYYIREISTDRDGNETIYIYCKIGDSYTRRSEVKKRNYYDVKHIDSNAKTIYRLFNNSDGWTGGGAGAYDALPEDFAKEIAEDMTQAKNPLRRYFDILDYKKETGDRNKGTYIGDELFLGRDCYVIEIMDVTRWRLWIDKKTGCTLKSKSTDGASECLEFKLENLKWDKTLKP